MDVDRAGRTVISAPLSNQPFMESVYVPAAEAMGLDLLPLIIRAAGLVIDGTNKDAVLAELSTMDKRAAEYLNGANRMDVLKVNDRIRRSIAEHLTGSDLSLYIG
jgi:hypothetical protein